MALMMIVAELDCKLNDDPDKDCDEAHCTNPCHDLQHLLDLQHHSVSQCTIFVVLQIKSMFQKHSNKGSPTFWMLGTFWTPLIRAAERPKKVLEPVAYTTACRSPCLIVEPPKAISPGPFLTGRDSPVRAA